MQESYKQKNKVWENGQSDSLLYQCSLSSPVPYLSVCIPTYVSYLLVYLPTFSISDFLGGGGEHF